MTPTVLGIDISKKTFHVALMLENGKTKPKVFSNDEKGFGQLITWLERHQATKVHACMELDSAKFFRRMPLEIERPKKTEVGQKKHSRRLRCRNVLYW